MTKKVYQARSALVHGGNKTELPNFYAINLLLRAAITQLLNSKKFKEVKKIDHLYEKVKDAQLSYEYTND